MVAWPFLAVAWGCLRFVIVVFPVHTQFLLFIFMSRGCNHESMQHIFFHQSHISFLFFKDKNLEPVMFI